MKTSNTLAMIALLFFLAGGQVHALPSKKGKSTSNKEDATVVVEEFRKHVETVPYFSDTALTAVRNQIDEHIKCLKNWNDREAYIEEHQLKEYISTYRDSLQYYKGIATVLIDNFLKQHKVGPDEEQECLNSMKGILDDKLGARETSLNLLDRELNTVTEKSSSDWKTVGWIVGGILLVGVLAVAFRKKGNQPAPPAPVRTAPTGQPGADGGIIVRRKTATILKKQSLEDVIGNPNYLQIDVADFSYESAVRRIYIKNTCIVDIYKMYAGDISNPDNAKEYGCMVLGRWVYDNESQEYYVSLEQIVLPGDDAVFAEYELNFGGKIKLRVLEQLRKLRRETNFQYDLTCWVHSHPGLGVFFSNSDVSVQTQLKHPTHPNFLTAIVVDVLTPTQELGIFTFRRDQNINSKNDLKRLYSLKEWYEWAVKSMGENMPDANEEFQHSDFFDTLSEAKSYYDVCKCVLLNREIIVDMCMSMSAQSSGFVGYVHGRSYQKDQKVEHLAELLSNNESVSKLDLVGCFVTDTHFSIPTIRKAVENNLEKMNFVLFYSPVTGVLTTIPVIDGKLATDENYYGEKQLEDLKIWTRKK